MRGITHFEDHPLIKALDRELYQRACERFPYREPEMPEALRTFERTAEDDRQQWIKERYEALANRLLADLFGPG